MTTFYSNGKLLLTGEYVVLDGALSLALPTQQGQSIVIKKINDPKLIWKSLDDQGTIWFEEAFKLGHFDGVYTERSRSAQCGSNIGNRLLEILKAAKQLNPDFLSDGQGYEVTSILEFPRDWGLGSSSTLINSLAHWAKVDAYKLLELTFGGSGYDIACAQYLGPLTYQLKRPFDSAQGDSKVEKTVIPIAFYPKFSKHLYFVHLNKKQNSREGIAHYKSNRDHLVEAISKITAITKLIINCDALITFEGLINRHEAIISKLIKLPTVKQALFSDYQGAIKSLGAWGGDFVLVTSKNNPTDYFKGKGYHTVIAYNDMVLK